MIPFSQETQDFLYENGYQVVAGRNHVSILNPKRDRWIVLIVVIVLSMILIPVSMGYPSIGLPILIALILITFHRFYSKKGFVIYTDREIIQFIAKNKVSFSANLVEVKEIKWTSKFVSEYASAFKLTTTEYEYKIYFGVNDQTMEVMRFLGDHETPDARFMEIYDFLRALIKKSKELNKG